MTLGMYIKNSMCTRAQLSASEQMVRQLKQLVFACLWTGIHVEIVRIVMIIFLEIVTLQSEVTELQKV